MDDIEKVPAPGVLLSKSTGTLWWGLHLQLQINQTQSSYCVHSGKQHFRPIIIVIC
jgi:hypothetical protein